MSKNILVTGGYGTLATHLLQNMVKDTKNFEISTTVRKLKPQNNIQNVTYITNDNFFSDDYKIDNIDIIINCAFSRTNNLPDLADSIAYTKKLFLKANENNIKAVVNISSQSVYGMYRENKTLETDKINPADVYALGKFACEELGNGIFQNSNTKYTNLRLGSLVGTEYTDRVVNKLIKKARETGVIEIENGRQQFGYLHVEDAAKAIIKLIETPVEKWNPVYNIGSDESGNLTLEEIAGFIKEKFEQKGLKVVLNKKTSSRKTIMNSGLFIKSTGWKHSKTLYNFMDDLINC